MSVEDLPICTYHEKDAGKYITAGLAVMRDPETGINNVGIYRHMVHEKNLLGVQLSETADGNIIWQKYEKRGLPCPVAIVIGHHPAFFIGSLCFSTLDSDEIKIAGGMLQRPVPLVRCKTIPLDVPADAEIVLECEIRPVERRAEAPFGEYPGNLRAAADESGAGDQGDHAAQESDLSERLRRPFRQPACCRD